MNRNEFRMAFHTLPFLNALAGSSGGVLELRARPVRRLLVWHPDAIEQIFRTDHELRHPPSRTLTPLLGQRSLLWTEGSRHAAYRRVLGPPLRGRRLADYHCVISDTAHAAVDALAPGTVIALADWTRGLTLRVIARIVLGHRDDAVLEPFTRWLDRALGSRHRTLVYRYLMGGLPRSGAELDRLLVGSASAIGHPPSLAALMSAEPGPLHGMDDAELRDQLVSLLFAGHETTASATAWTLYLLDRHPQIGRDVLSELDATTDDGSDPTKVPLLHAVIQEALRLAPPVALAGNRAPAQDGELLGGPLAAGTVLLPSIYLAHHNPDHHPRPHQFRPDRFLDHRVAARHYFPFGGGVRHCLGSALAMVEIRMIVAAVLRRRELRCVNPSAGVPQLRGHAMAPSSRLRMEVSACRA